MNGRSILVTGGTGSFGKAFVAEVLARWPDIKRLVVFSRDELKQYEMAQQYPPDRYPALRFFIGDIRNRDRLRRALEGVELVVHAAALKQVPAAEYNPIEFINTNIIGAENLRSTCTVRPSCAPTNCSLPPTTFVARATCAFPWSATAM
jgi:UDP-N-acetylglucosamine 4,6-dehydratase/5-epimerase